MVLYNDIRSILWILEPEERNYQFLYRVAHFSVFSID